MNHSEEDTALVNALYEISSLTTRDIDPGQASEVIVEAIAKALGAEGAFLALVNPDCGLLEIEATCGLWQLADTPPPRLGEGLTTWATLHGKPISIADFSKTTRFLPPGDLICSEMAAPLVEKESVIGVVSVGWKRGSVFDDLDVEKLSKLSIEAALVLDRIWLVQRLEKKARQLGSLLAAGKNLVSRHGLGEVLKTIPGEALNIMDCKVCALFLLSPDGKSLTLQVAAGAPRLVDYTENLNLEDSALGSAVQYHKQVEIPDLRKTEEHHFVPVVQSEGLVSMLATPISYDDEPVGVLNVYTEKRHRFDDGEKSHFAALAGLVAVAIQNARLYEKILAGEEILRRSERLGTLGLLTSEIAHEIRNPLTVIKLLFESLDLDYPTGDLRRKDVEIIGERLNHLDEIVHRVLDFGKTGDYEHTKLDMDLLIRDAMTLVRLKLAQKSIHLTYKPAPETVAVSGNRGQLQQIFLNLFLNAYEAVPEGGTIEVSLRTENQNNEPAAVIEFADNGRGIPEEIQENIFDSCFSGRKEGAGLGLAIVERILHSHHGSIELVRSSPEGTTLVMTLPLAAEGG